MENKDYTNGELGIILEGLATTIKDGFNGVHERQDKTNGNVKRNTEFRYTIKGQIRVWQWIVGFCGFAGILQVMSLIFKFN